MGRSTLRTLGALLAAAVVAVSLAIVVSAWPRHPSSPFVEGQPLLGHDADWVADTQIGLQFKPPSGWAMQARTSASGKPNVPPRLVVKFKRLLPGVPVAWLRVNILDASEPASPADYLRGRKAPEKDWKPVKEVEDGVKVGELSAARITFGGPFDPEGRGQRDFTCEIVAVRRGPQIFEFSGTFPSADVEARKQVRAAIESVAFSR